MSICQTCQAGKPSPDYVGVGSAEPGRVGGKGLDLLIRSRPSLLAIFGFSRGALDILGFSL
jgi:hypothetical protein